MSSIWRTLDRQTLRAIALVCLADAIVGASFGAITVSGGLPAWVPIVMSLLIFAGGAQFAAAAVLIAGGSPVAAVLAGLVLNARLLPYGFTVADAIGGRPGKPGQSWIRLLGAHVITDESVAFTMRQYRPRQAPRHLLDLRSRTVPVLERGRRPRRIRRQDDAATRTASASTRPSQPSVLALRPALA